MHDLRIEPLIVVASVARSRDFYLALLGLEAAHSGDEYEMLVHDGRLLLQLHASDTHEHPGLWTWGVASGNGIALWFRTPDFDAVLDRIRRLGIEVVDGPLVNPNAMQDEIWVRDPDDYLVVVSNRFGSAAGGV